jgi:hypothetical protein
VPLTDNEGRALDPRVIVDLHRDLLGQFGGFTIHPISQGRWRSQEGRIYQEEVIFYEIAIPEAKVTLLREVVCRLGRGLGQLAMYFDAPAPSVEIIDLLQAQAPASERGGRRHEPGSQQATRRGSKKNRPAR